MELSQNLTLRRTSSPKDFLRTCVHVFQIELEFGSVGWLRNEVSRENLLNQRRESLTNCYSTHTRHLHLDLSPGHIGVRQVLSPLHYCFLQATKSGGTLVVVGMGKPEVKFPIVDALVREVDIRGIFRYVNW